MELRLLRLTVLLAAVSFLGFDGYSAYCFKEAAEWGKLAEEHARLYILLIKNEKTKQQFPIDEANPYDKVVQQLRESDIRLAKMFDTPPGSLSNMIDHEGFVWRTWKGKADLMLTLAIALPLFFFFCFYSIRWIVLGRIRPFFPES